MQLTEVLQEMRDLLMKHGWCQNEYRNFENNLCLLGALSATSHDHKQFGDVIRLLAREIYDGYIIPGSTVSTWNDTKGRTFNEVIDLLDRVIIAEKEKTRDSDEEG